jgi:hypothetical protein
MGAQQSTFVGLDDLQFGTVFWLRQTELIRSSLSPRLTESIKVLTTDSQWTLTNTDYKLKPNHKEPERSMDEQCRDWEDIMPH